MGDDRHSRYFNMVIFRRNKDSHNDRLNFGAVVKELLDNTRFRISTKDLGNKKVFSFWMLDKRGKIGMARPLTQVIVMNNGNVLNVKKSKCLWDPYVNAVAVKLGYLKWESKYDTIFRVTNISFYRRHKDTEKEIVEMRDRFYNKVRIPVAELYKTYHFISRFRSYRNLLPFQKSPVRLLALLKKKILKINIRQLHEKRRLHNTD